MANYCHNAVTFSGPLPALIRVRLLFSEMEQENHSGLPDFVQSDTGHMTDVGVGEKAIYFRTRWVPNLDVVQQIAEHFGLDYTDRYEEPNMFIFGETSWQNGEYRHFYLERRDLKGMQYDEASAQFLYKGETYDDDIEVWEAIIEQKKKQLAEKGYLFQTASGTSRADLTEIYGELPSGDLFLKLAEHQNFAAAEALFDTWDEETIVIMDNYLIAALHDNRIMEKNRDEYIAHLFLVELIDQHEPKKELNLNCNTSAARGPKR